jgi:hypothetical protein
MKIKKLLTLCLKGRSNRKNVYNIKIKMNLSQKLNHKKIQTITFLPSAINKERMKIQDGSQLE